MKRDFPLISALFILACLAVMPYVKWYADNPDSLQYISIANHIIEGRWTLAINGYWSPLITWLLTPFILIFGDGIIAFKYLQIAIGIFVITQWISFLNLTSIDIKWKRILGFALIPFMVSYSLLNLTPDLLFLGILLALLVELISWLDKKSDGSKLGKLGGLLFLTKSFGLPLFVFLFCIAIWMKDERVPKSILKKVFYPFIGISGVWILLLSVKYGQFTISESAKFNFTYEVAPVPEKTVQLPVLGSGLLQPANDHALSAWEEPSSQIKLTPLDPIRDPSYYLSVVKRNLLSIYYHDFRNQIGWAFLFFLIIFLIVRRAENRMPLWIKVSIVMILSLYCGYSLILVHDRYIWICSLLLLPIIIFFISEIFSSARYVSMRNVLTVLLVLFAMKRPVKEVLLCGDRELNALQFYHTIFSPKETMITFYGTDMRLHDDIVKLKRIVPAHSNFASIKDTNYERDGYARSLLVAYELQGKYLGQTTEADSSFKGYLISYKEESGETIYASEWGMKVYLR